LRNISYKKVKQSRYTPWRRFGERRYSSYSFTTSSLDGSEWSASRPGRAFTPGERTPGTHWTGGWVGPRAGLDTEFRGKILCLCRGSNPEHILYMIKIIKLTLHTHTHTHARAYFNYPAVKLTMQIKIRMTSFTIFPLRQILVG
jgi:hypothetical protein